MWGLFFLSQFASAQSGNWTYDSVFTGYRPSTPNTYNQFAAYDQWGKLHYAWVAQDPNSAGFQLLYSDNATGVMGQPSLATDIGTLHFESGTDTNVAVVRLDRETATHIAFLANVNGPNGFEVGLYYTSNRGQELVVREPVLLTNASRRYGMAVDSGGTGHVVWLTREIGQPIRIWYWNSTFGPDTRFLLDSIECTGGCRFIDPQVAISNKTLKTVIRTEAGATYLLTTNVDTRSGKLELLPIPSVTHAQDPWGRKDLRSRLAVDTSGGLHLLVPFRPHMDSALQILYVTNPHGTLAMNTLFEGERTTVLEDFDISTDASGRLAAAWTTDRNLFPGDIPITGFVEYQDQGFGLWQQIQKIENLNVLVGMRGREGRIVRKLTIYKDRVCIVGSQYSLNGSGPENYYSGQFLRHAARPETSYMLPDAAAPGMNVVVETYAPAHAFGSFGNDTLAPVEIGLEFVNPSDSARLIIGPSVVSWDGRLLSTLLFVRHDAEPGEVELRVNVGGQRSNPQKFYVQEAQSVGVDGSGVLSGGGLLGSGGIYGVRSPRGVLVVDSLILKDGLYRISLMDTDASLDGNQGFLPLTILSRGPVVIDTNAVLSVSASDGIIFGEEGYGGPGGGGGGAGMKRGGGMGYTAGGRPSETITGAFGDGANTGSGGTLSGRYIAGGSLNGVSGGVALPGAAAGGGTGHPFGASGRQGIQGLDLNENNNPIVVSARPLFGEPGGHGAGTGGDTSHSKMGVISHGGGGGGFGTSGESGENYTNGDLTNAGQNIGSSVLVPLAGGSGGGGAYSSRGEAFGGGGGGAIALYSFRSLHLNGKIVADGGSGATENSFDASGGGGGSGGGILMGAQGGIIVGTGARLSAMGGKGGAARPDGVAFYSKGGDGGIGRIRLDGRIDLIDPENTPSFDSPQPGHHGPSSGMSGSFQAIAGGKIGGTGNPGEIIRVYLRPEHGGWSYNKPRDVLVNDEGEWVVELADADIQQGLVYVAVLQKIDGHSGALWNGVPRWVMSTAGGNIIGRPAAGLSTTDAKFGCVDYGECKVIEIAVNNTGTQGDLQIFNGRITGGSGWTMIPSDILMRIRPGESSIIRIQFCPDDTGSVLGKLELKTNLPGADSVQIVDLSGCGIAGLLHADRDTIDLGDMCPDECRDTVIVLRNDGDAPLTVNKIESAENRLNLTFLNPADTSAFDLAPGEKRAIPLRICLDGSPGDFAVLFRATTPFPTTNVLFTYRDVGPQVRLPEQLDFGTRDLGKNDTCRILEFPIENRSSTESISIDVLHIDGVEYEILSPARGTEIAPLESIQMRVRFCSDIPGVYNDNLDLAFLSGNCQLEVRVPIKGRVVRSAANLQLEVSDKIDFGSVPVDITSSPRDIVLFNSGTGTAEGIWYEINPIAPTTLDEIQVELAGVSGPFALTSGKRETFTVRMTPAATGLRQAEIVITSADGFSATIPICVNGVEAGIVPDSLYLDFGSLRVGTSVEKDMGFFNAGTFVDELIELDTEQLNRFILVKTSSTLPVTLRPSPSTDRMLATLRFRPGTVGKQIEKFKAITKSGDTIEVELVGTGLLEKAEADVQSLDFTCENRRGSVTLVNTGTWPLVINSIDFNDSRFQLVSDPGQIVLQPMATRSYEIEYLPGASTLVVRATATVRHSGTGQLTVDLYGEPCAPELNRLVFRVPDLEARLDSTVYVPVELDVQGQLEEDVPFSLQLEYEWSLLVPESLISLGKQSGAVDATELQIEEVKPGLVTIQGILAEGSGSGTIVEIPMRVLLGRTYRTVLAISGRGNPALPAAYRALYDSGTFIGLDCDTSGTIDIAGRYVIKQNAPNPFRQNTVIRFEIARREHVRIVLYNSSGNIIAVLLDEVLDAGEHELVLGPETASAGRYFYEIISGRFRAVRNMLIVE